MKNEQITIELADDVTDELMKIGSSETIDLNYLPFKSFSIIISDLFNELDYEEFKNLLKSQSSILPSMEVYKDFLKHATKPVLDVKIEGNKINLTRITNGKETSDVIISLSSMTISSENYESVISNVEINKDTEDFIDRGDYGEILSKTIVVDLTLVLGLIKYMQGEPTEKIVKNRVIENKPNKKKNKKGSNKKTYIYKTKYIVQGIERPVQERTFERRTESWISRGHWRTYKSGKKIWINETIKHAKDTPKDSVIKKDYKITKI